MPAVDDPFSIAASLPGQVAKLAQAVKDLSVNRTFSPAIFTVGAGGLTDLGPLAVTGATTLTGGVTGTVAATGALSGASLAVGAGGIAGGAITGASVAVTGASTSATVTTSGNVSASGQVISTGIMQSPGSRAYNVVAAGGFVGTWQDVNGNFGFNPSGVEFKQDFQPAPLDDITNAVLHLALLRYRYISEVRRLGDAAPWRVGTIAQYMEQGPLAEWVTITTSGAVINWEQFAVPLVATVQSIDARLKSVEARLKAAGL